MCVCSNTSERYLVRIVHCARLKILVAICIYVEVITFHRPLVSFIRKFVESAGTKVTKASVGSAKYLSTIRDLRIILRSPVHMYKYSFVSCYL